MQEPGQDDSSLNCGSSEEVKDLGHILEAELTKLVDSFGRPGVRS